MKLIKSLFSKKVKEVSLDDMDVDQLIAKHTEAQAEYDMKKEELDFHTKYFMGINQRVAAKLSSVKVGDLLKLKYNNKTGRSVLVTQLYWDPNVYGPIPDVNIICQTWKSDKDKILLTEKPFSISYTKENERNPFSVKDYTVRKNINEQIKDKD